MYICKYNYCSTVHTHKSISISHENPLLRIKNFPLIETFLTNFSGPGWLNIYVSHTYLPKINFLQPLNRMSHIFPSNQIKLANTIYRQYICCVVRYRSVLWRLTSAKQQLNSSIRTGKIFYRYVFPDLTRTFQFYISDNCKFAIHVLDHPVSFSIDYLIKFPVFVFINETISPIRFCKIQLR